jgi:hypothetical protein
LTFEWIDAEKAHWPVSKMCKALEVTTSGFYAWRKRPPSTRTREDERLRALVEESHRASRSNYGSPRVHRDLRARGERVSRKRVIRLMRGSGLEGKVRRRCVTTTDGRHDQPVASNVLAQDFEASGPNIRCDAAPAAGVISGAPCRTRAGRYRAATNIASSVA